MEHKDMQNFAEKTIKEYMKPVYSFVLKRTRNVQDSDDLVQEICLKLYKTLLVKNDIGSIEKFVWTVARHSLANYYRGKSKSFIGNIDDFSEVIESEESLPEDKLIERETLNELQKEIAYLSKIQRKAVVLYYYYGKKQSEIAEILGVPIGTVKWHLCEAKKELKKGLDSMKNTNELKFNPIQFDMLGANGSVGTMGGPSNFFRSKLSQNIAYCIWKEAKTVNEIAECLGVSPVYVESEAEFLEEYGFLIKQGNKYLANILIDEGTTEQAQMQSEMYEKAAKLIANDLYDELMESKLLGSGGLVYPDRDKNFLMWSLIPYICALSGEKLMENKITFEEAATIRPDGGTNIVYASVLNNDVIPPKYFESMKNWFGPCWNGTKDTILWLINSEWSDRDIDFDSYARYIDRDLNLLERFAAGEKLAEEDYAFMAEKGYIKKQDEQFVFAIVRICDMETREKLIKIGDQVKGKHWNELKALRDQYVKMILDETPKEMKKMQGFGLQYIFYADGWFLLHCMKELVGNGKLKLPREDQRKSLTMLMLPNHLNG